MLGTDVTDAWVHAAAPHVRKVAVHFENRNWTQVKKVDRNRIARHSWRLMNTAQRVELFAD